MLVVLPLAVLGVELDEDVPLGWWSNPKLMHVFRGHKRKSRTFVEFGGLPPPPQLRLPTRSWCGRWTKEEDAYYPLLVYQRGHLGVATVLVVLLAR